MADQPKPNPALRMLGLPNLPRKLPSRNWLIFWGVTSSLAAAIVYDRREKKRATARWALAVAPLAREPMPSTSALPRRVTVFLEAPPGDSLRAAQDHFKEYIKPVLASSGLDWEFVVGRRQGDVRAAVAERVRRQRRKTEVADGAAAAEADLPTDDDVVAAVRQRNGIAEYEGVKGDLVVGRHTWKEYVRGLHEGWLGPLTAPPPPADADAAGTTDKPEADKTEKPDPPPEAEAPKRPPQPKPYNRVEDYPSSPLPRFVPAELGPSVPVRFPHLLGFLNTPVRIYRFLHRRAVADEIGREVAAVCFATATRAYGGADAGDYEQERVLAFEEKDWVKTVWKDDDAAADVPDRTWRQPVVIDPRIGSRMRRFELAPEQAAAAQRLVVPEAQIEGWTKGKLRQLAQWAARSWRDRGPKPVDVGNVDDDN